MSTAILLKRLIKLDLHAEWLQGPGEASPLAANIGIGEDHAQACFFVHCIDVRFHVAHDYLHGIRRGGRGGQLNSVLRMGDPMGNEEHAG